MSDERSPPYTDPATVLSPKGSVESLRVLQNTGQDGYAVASMLWGGKESLGIRWNGNAKNPIGNPQSRGIATWFIFPDAVAAMLRPRFGETLGGLNDQNSAITRVRIRPVPHRVWKGAAEEPTDDEWVLSITDRAQGYMEIMNPRTSHFMAVDQSQVRSLVRDTARDTPSGPKHGILSLNVQMMFEDGRLTLEPLQSLRDRIALLSNEMHKAGYAGFSDRVLSLAQEARTELARSSGELGPWETECLDHAQAAVAVNFLQLAMTSISKAVDVSELPVEDYEYGFNYASHDQARANAR